MPIVVARDFCVSRESDCIHVRADGAHSCEIGGRETLHVCVFKALSPGGGGGGGVVSS